MRVANIQAETQALLTVLVQRNPALRVHLFNQLQPHHFAGGAFAATPTITRKLYDHLHATYIDVSVGIPDLKALLVSGLPGEIKDWLENVDSRVACSDQASWDAVLVALGAHTKTRGVKKIVDIGHDMLKSSDDKPIDFGALEDAFALVNQTDSSALKCNVIAHGSRTEVRERLLRYLDVDRRRKRGLDTGWKVFDKVTGGLQPGQVCLLAANSGGCKSMAALQIGAHAFGLGKKVAYFSLEMSDEEITKRLIANVMQTPFGAINNMGTVRERIETLDAFDSRFHGSSHGSWACFEVPANSISRLTLRDIDKKLLPNYYDLVIIDYVSLVDREDRDSKLTEEQWLRGIVDKIKKMAQRKNCVMLVLAQLHKSGDLAQAKSMKNGVDYLLKWTHEVKDGVRPVVIDVEIDKARSPQSHETGFKLDTRLLNCCCLIDYVDLGDVDFQPPKSKEEGM